MVWIVAAALIPPHLVPVPSNSSALNFVAGRLRGLGFISGVATATANMTIAQAGLTLQPADFPMTLPGGSVSFSDCSRRTLTSLRLLKALTALSYIPAAREPWGAPP